MDRLGWARLSSAGLYFLYFFSGGSDIFVHLFLYLTFAEYMCVLHWHLHLHLQQLGDANKIANATLGTILSTGGFVFVFVLLVVVMYIMSSM